MNQKKDAMDYNIFVRFVKFMWSGLMYAKRSKPVLIGYIALIIITIIYNSIYGDCAEILFIDFFVVLGVSIYLYRLEKPIRRMRRYFFNIFEQMQFQTKEGNFPLYLYDEPISEYQLLVKFYSLIPLSEWNKKIETLEMYMNAKLAYIEQDKNDKRRINLVVQTKPLPEFVEWDDRYIDYSNNILNIGVSSNGLEGIDLEMFPHSFIAGETGSGKSNVLKCLIYQSIKKNYKIDLIDFKRGVSFTAFTNLQNIHYEYSTALEVLKNAVKETKCRLDKFRGMGVDNLNAYNRVSDKKLKRQIVFIDELAELLKIRDKEISNLLYDSIETLTRLSRAVGIHLIMGIQRPDSTIVNGQIKNNVSFRLCGRFVDREPSQIMLGSDIASKLPNIKGRFIMRTNEVHELQAFCYTDIQIRPIEPEIEVKKEIDSTNSFNPILEPLNVSEDTENDGRAKETTTPPIEFDFSDID